MRIIITGGGTAGHVTPLLAIATEVSQQYPTAKVRYIGQIADPMSAMLKQPAIIEKQYAIFAGKWRRYHGLSTFGHLTDIKTMTKNIRDAFYLLIGYLQSVGILLFWRPEVVFVKGGYVGLPVGLAAATLKIPIVTHDSDSIPGLTNRILSRFAKLMAVGLPDQFYASYYPKAKLRFTGTPIRPAFLKATPHTKTISRRQLAIDHHQRVVTIIGGSLGAIRLNELVMQNLPRLLRDPSIYILWVAGNHQQASLLEWVSSLKTGQSRLKLYGFTQSIDQLMMASDIVVSRAGATSIAELAALAKPTILVPNPYLAGGHQLKNAEALARDQAVISLTEAALAEQPLLLSTEITRLLNDIKLRQTLSTNIQAIAVSDAASRIVAVIKEAMAI